MGEWRKLVAVGPMLFLAFPRARAAGKPSVPDLTKGGKPDTAACTTLR